MAYFSNGAEGGYLDAQCGECPLRDDAPCPILLVQSLYNYEQLDKGNGKLREAMNLLIDEGGNCKMKPLIEQATGDPPIPEADPMPSMREWARKHGLRLTR